MTSDPRHHRRYREHAQRLKRQWAAKRLPCHWCGKTLRFDVGGLPDSVEADHLNPISAGGHWAGEMVPSCRRCNQSRGNKPADVYRATMQEKTESRKRFPKLEYRPDGWYLVHNAP